MNKELKNLDKGTTTLLTHFIGGRLGSELRVSTKGVDHMNSIIGTIEALYTQYPYNNIMILDCDLIQNTLIFTLESIPHREERA